jgi:vacuolar protein sorting-associated protein VTA1
MNRQTADTLLAAATFLEILSIWKENDPEITSKIKFAKYHALRIVKAMKANEDPNASNPVQETQQQPMSPPALDPNDPEVQRINQGAPPQQQSQNPYQPYVETAPNTSTQPSPNFSARQVSPPPPNLPSAPTGYTQSSHNDVSPISQPAPSRQGSVVSIGGGYFPKTEPPTFTAETTAPGLPTAPMDVDPLSSSLPTSPQAPPASDPASFYQNTAAQPPQQQPPPQTPYQSPPQPISQAPQQPLSFFPSPAAPPQHYQYAAPSPQPPQKPAHLRSQSGAFSSPAQQQFSPAVQQNPYAQSSAPPPQQYSQGPFRNDEDSIMAAQKHAKWAISALNFEDADTAVKELRTALRALGAL